MHGPTRRWGRPGQFPLLVATAWLAACSDHPTSTLLGPEPEGPIRSDVEVQQLDAPINDDFDDAIVVTGLPFSHATNTEEATTAFDDPDCFGQGPTVWYVFTPSEDITIEANTFGSDYDTTLSVYMGTRGDLVEMACNDDAAGGVQSRVVVPLIAGETVYFMIGAFGSGPGGNLIFNIDIAPPPPPPLEASLSIDRFGTFDPKTGVGTIRGTFACSRPAFVDLFGILRDRIGRIRVEAFFGGFFFCAGSGRWETQVFAENAFLVGGPVEVELVAFFFDPATDGFAFVEEAATVRLRGSGRESSRITADGPAAVQLFEASPQALDDLMGKVRGKKPRP